MDEEKAARLIAQFHGSAMVYRDAGGMHTVASMKGYGNWGHSPEKYAERHWHEYRVAASALMEALREEGSTEGDDHV